MFIEKDFLFYGVIISVGSGVVLISGFLMAFVSETFRISYESEHSLGDLCIGLVVNLYRDETMNLIIGALLLNPDLRVTEGAKVNGLGRLSSICLGDSAIGSILDPIGHFILNSSKIDAQHRWVIESPAPGIIDRQSVFEPLQTGIVAIDSMVPIGRGQRELVVGDRQTGKTSIGIDTILNQKYEKVLCVYVPIGQKAASILEVFLSLVNRDAVFYMSMLVASASSSAVCQFLCAYTGSALSEFFMIVGELPSFIMLDDLSRHAVAYREIYLLLRRPPGREAFPGEIFIISSITDGQIFLSIDLFLAGIKPAIDVGLSVTRVGSVAQWDGMKYVSGSYKLELAQFVELQSFSQFAADLGPETKSRLERGRRLIELLKQFCGFPISLAREVAVLSLANQELISNLAIEDVQTFLGLYMSVPIWVYLFVPVRLIGTAVLEFLVPPAPLELKIMRKS